MRRAALFFLVALATGCASSGPDTTAQGPAGSEATIDMIVINRTTGAVTAFAQWRTGARIRLGEIAGGATRRFTTPYRGSEVWLALDVLSAPSVGTTPGPTRFNDPTDGRVRENISYVSTDPFDTFEWEIRQTFPSIDLFYRRLQQP